MAIKPINIKNMLKRVSVRMSTLVRNDSLKSFWQDNRKGGRYKSQQYKKYKANNMRRFTDGKRLKQYKGISIRSGQISKVNMTLTGQMSGSLKGTKFTKNSFFLAYKNDKTTIGKIVGNKELGRDVVGLNKKNEKIISKIYEKELIRYFNTI